MLDAIATASRRLTRSVLLAAVFACLAPLAAAAAEPPTTIVVFDGSGSMWGKLAGDKDSKFAGAREALRRALPKIDPVTLVGLAAFGHRRKGDCSDTELMLEPEPLDLARLMAPLEKFNPKGKGPLVAAMKHAAGQLERASGAASLILIHDDPDNCAQDPCAAAEEIARVNPQLAIHVISIGLANTEAQKMSCVPRLTGGRHFDAQDATALATAVEDALKLASLDDTPAAIAAPGTAAAPAPAMQPAAAALTPPVEDTGPPRLILTATLGQAGPAVIVPLAWRVTRRGGGTALAAVRAASLELNLPAGAYEVEAQHGLVSTTDTVEVKANGATRAAVALPAGAVRMSASLHRGTPPLEQAVFSISDVPSGSALPRTVWSGGADAPPVFLPVGTWRISAEYDRVRAERQVMVTPGAMIDAALTLGAGRLRVKASDREGGAALERVTFRVTEDDADSPDGRREVARSSAAEPEFTLSAGTYYLSARQGQAEVRERVLVNAGDDVARTLVLALGQLNLQSRLAGSGSVAPAGISYLVDRIDAKRETIRLGSQSGRLELPAGRYRVVSQLGAQNARITREIEIRAGGQSNLAFEHLAANIQLKATGPRASAAGDLSWHIRDAQDRSVWQSLQAEPRAFLAAGRYKIEAESRDRRGSAEIEVSGGEVRVVEVQLE